MSEPAYDDLYEPIEGVVIDAEPEVLSGDVQMRVTQGAARERVKQSNGLPEGMRPLTPEESKRGNEVSAKKRSNVNRYNVAQRAREMGVDPTEIICLLLQNTPEARARLNLPPNAKTSPALMGKLATELLSYMAPKLKSVEVKENPKKGDKQGVRLFMPVNGREEKSDESPEVLELSVEDLAEHAMREIADDNDG